MCAPTRGGRRLLAVTSLKMVAQRYTVQDISALLGHVKLISIPLDVLPTSLFISVFDSTGRHIVEMVNVSLHTGIVLSFSKQAVVEPILKKPYLDQQESVMVLGWCFILLVSVELLFC